MTTTTTTTPVPTCPAWCTIGHEGPDDEGLHRADVERTDGFTVTVYRTDPADYQVHVDTNSFRGLTVEEALGLADALVRAARLVERVVEDRPGLGHRHAPHVTR